MGHSTLHYIANKIRGTSSARWGSRQYVMTISCGALTNPKGIAGCLIANKKWRSVLICTKHHGIKMRYTNQNYDIVGVSENGKSALKKGYVSLCLCR